MYTIKRSFYFNATSILTDLPADHPGKGIHGYDYTVVITLESSTLGKDGFVYDFRKLHYIKDFLKTKCNRKHLNDIMILSPTAENIAKFIFDMFIKTYPLITAVTVISSYGMEAKYSPEYVIDSK